MLFLLKNKEQPKYVCGQEGCTQMFTTWTLLQKHIKSDHKRICPICNQEFAKQYAYRVHMERHNGIKESKKIICPQCQKELSSVSNKKYFNFFLLNCSCNK